MTFKGKLCIEPILDDIHAPSPQKLMTAKVLDNAYNGNMDWSALDLTYARYHKQGASPFISSA